MGSGRPGQGWKPRQVRASLNRLLQDMKVKHLALQIRVHSRNAPCVSGSPRRHDPRPASHRAGQRQGVGIPHKVNTANLAWSTGTPASLHQHQYGRAQRQLQWRYCQGESEAFLSLLLEIHVVTYFCFVFLLYFHFVSLAAVQAQVLVP